MWTRIAIELGIIYAIVLTCVVAWLVVGQRQQDQAIGAIITALQRPAATGAK